GTSPALPDDSNADGGDQACIPQPFTGSLSLGADGAPDCDADPSSCASPCASGPLAEEWHTFAVETNNQNYQAVDFGGSLVDDAGDIYFSSCGGSSASSIGGCGLSSVTSKGSFHSSFNLNDAFNEAHLVPLATLLAGPWAIVALGGSSLMSSAVVVAQ